MTYVDWDEARAEITGMKARFIRSVQSSPLSRHTFFRRSYSASLTLFRKI